MDDCYFDYLATLTPLRAGRVRKQLNTRVRYEDEVQPAALFIAGLIAKGASPVQKDGMTAPCGSRRDRKEGKPRAEYRLMLTDNQFVKVSKTEYDFARYLVENGGTTPDGQAALRAKEQARIDEIHAAAEAQKAREREERRRRIAFKEWLNAEVPNYLNDPRMKVMEDIFMRDYGFFDPLQQGSFIVLIDNIDNPLARAELISWLNQLNKSSKKVFRAVTGIKLPRTDKGTRRILEALTSKDIREGTLPQ